MASSATTLSSSSLHYQHQQSQQHPTLSRPGKKSNIGGIATASTPNLNSLYSAHSRLAPPTGSLARKGSLAALTPGSLASIPDDSESYALDSVLNDGLSTRKMPPMPPLTPGKSAGSGDDFALGDQVDVPGNMVGTVRFVGSVAGRKGVFAGVELNSEYAPRGKNSGEVDGYVDFRYRQSSLSPHRSRVTNQCVAVVIVSRILPPLCLELASSFLSTSCSGMNRPPLFRIHPRDRLSVA